LTAKLRLSVLKMADDNDDILNISRAKIADTALDYRRVAEGEERFESSHPVRATGGEKNCGDFIQVERD